LVTVRGFIVDVVVLVDASVVEVSSTGFSVVSEDEVRTTGGFVVLSNFSSIADVNSNY